MLCNNTLVGTLPLANGLSLLRPAPSILDGRFGGPSVATAPLYESVILSGGCRCIYRCSFLYDARWGARPVPVLTLQLPTASAEPQLQLQQHAACLSGHLQSRCHLRLRLYTGVWRIDTSILLS